jgi:xylulokinase
MVRAVMEGVVFALRQGLELMQSLGTPVERLLASGGATRHALWLQLQADIFNRPVAVSQADEATARGAALLAGMGAGLYAGADEAIAAAAGAVAAGVSPNPRRAEAYDRAFRQYARWAEQADRFYGAGDFVQAQEKSGDSG